MTRTIEFKVTYWHHEDVEEENDHRLVIHMCGITVDNQTVYCLVQNFRPFVYIELPTRIKWTESSCKAVFEYFQRCMKSEGPLEWSIEKKYMLRCKKPIKCLRFSFPTQRACQKFSSRCQYAYSPICITGVGTFQKEEFKVHEHNIEPIIKFSAKQNIKMSGWVRVKEYDTTVPLLDGSLVKDKSLLDNVSEDTSEDESEDSEDLELNSFSSSDIDLYANWSDVIPIPDKNDIVIWPKFASFDIECYSTNHNSKLPDPNEPRNIIFQIATVFGRTSADLKKVLLSMYDLNDIEGVEVVRCKSEKALLLKWASYINEENVDAFIGYNIMKFDWHYMVTRAELLGIYPQFVQISRLLGRKAMPRKLTWSSSAYKEQEFKFLEVHGRINIDVLLEMERNYKFPKYSLDYVSEFFLKENKEDVTPRQLFMLVKFVQDAPSIIEKVSDRITKKEYRILLAAFNRLLPPRLCTGKIKEFRQSVIRATSKERLLDLIKTPLTITGTYCVKDTILPVKLYDKLNLWTTMQEMSNCMHIPISYLHTRGQQIKVLAQVYRETLKDNIIIPKKMEDKEGKYQGAIVIEANPGNYKNVACYDYASLYPSTIILKNICYTTFVEATDPTPDSECHILEWDDHKGCEHDTQHKNVKKEDILCKHHRYRFRKVVTLPDGTRKNEGLLPRLERKLLSERKTVRKELAKIEAKYKMATGKATEKDIKEYEKYGYEIITKGSLTDDKLTVLSVLISILNSQQLALKVSANSMYGTLGTKTGFIPFVEGAASVTAVGRELITSAIAYIRKTHKNAVLIYGDTDSAMITLEGLDVKESFAMAEKISQDTSHYLKCTTLGIPPDYKIECPSESDGSSKTCSSKTDDSPKMYYSQKMYGIAKYPRNKLSELSDEDRIKIHEYDANPINLQFENLYGRYILLTKKRYICVVVNRDGEIMQIVKKGVVDARRDNSRYLRDTYKSIYLCILDEKDDSTIMYTLYDRIHALFTRQIPDSHLIIYTGVSSIMNYAKHKEIKKGSESEKYLVNKKGERIKDPTGPFDPRLVYSNIPQVILTLKMLKRGDDVPPNTRLEYLYLDVPNVEHQGQKAEDYTFYRENKVELSLKPDFPHYIEKQLAKPITELLNVKYCHFKKGNKDGNRIVVPYEKHEDAIKRHMKSLTELQRHAIENIKKFTKNISVRTYKSSKVLNEIKTYEFSGFAAQVEYILDSSKKYKIKQSTDQPCDIRDIDGSKHKNLIRSCLLWKSRSLIDKIHKTYGIKKKPLKRPTQVCEKLRVRTKKTETHIVLLEKIEKYPVGSIGILKEIRERQINSIFKKKITYDYDIQMKDNRMLLNVPRDKITTFTYKDDRIFNDIILARTHYKNTVKQLDDMFSVKFIFNQSKSTNRK